MRHTSPLTQIDCLSEAIYWRAWHALNDVKSELSLSSDDVKRIAKMTQVAFYASLQSQHKLDSGLRLKVETLITGGDYPDSDLIGGM